MEEVVFLFTSSSNLVHNIVSAYKGYKGVTELKAGLEELKKQLMTEEANRVEIMQRKRDELRAQHQKLLEAERNSQEKIFQLRQSLRDKSEMIRNDFENSLLEKNEKIRQCVENIMDIHKENSEKVDAMNLEMKSKLEKVIDEYEKKVGSVDEDLRNTFEKITEIHNEYKERMDVMNDRHRDEIRRKEKEHVQALKEKDRFLSNILMTCYELHKEIQCIQDKRAEDVIRAALMEKGYSVTLQGAKAVESIGFSQTLPVQYNRSSLDSTDNSADSGDEANQQASK